MNNTNKKVLIVEDDEDFLFILQANLKKEGFSVITAKNGKDGLTMIEKEKPDLIVLDILMPVMDGLEMAMEMKKNNMTIPIIFLTNVKDIDSISKAVEIIPSDYIIKSDMSIDKIIAEIKRKLTVGQ